MTNNKTSNSRATLLQHKKLTASFGVTFSLAIASLSGVAYAANTTTDPDPDVETGSYISLNLNQTIVAAGDSFSGTATIYEGDGDVDSDDPITEMPSSQTANGIVNFAVSTSSPGDVTIVASSADASSKSVVGHAVAVNEVLTPSDNFPGRSQTSYGVAENINLSLTTTPSGYENQIGTPTWTGSGDGITTDYGGGTGLFFAGDVAGSASVTLSITSGPLSGKSFSKSRTIVAPSGVSLVKTGNVIHTQGTASAGFHANTYFTPTNVSFFNISEEEEYSSSEENSGMVGPKGVGTGAYSYLNGKQHTGGGYNRGGYGNISTGCLIGTDYIYSGALPVPVSQNGDFTWTIPRDYMVYGGTTVHSGYTSLVHHQTVTATDARGNTVTSISKGGIGPISTNSGDPTSN